MSVVNIENTHNIDHREEVRKLQNLVRELEVQNLQLRNKQLASNFALDKHKEQTLGNVNKSKLAGMDQIGNGEPLDETELIDVDRLNLSLLEDSWLYEPPDDVVSEVHKTVSPYKWMRSDADDPRIQSVKSGLVNRIEALTSTPSARRILPENLDREESSLPRNALSTKLLYEKLNKEVVPSNSGLDRHRNFDSRTFTRPKKTVIADLPVVDAETAFTPKLTTISSPTSDVIDIQTLARLQEECLRQSSSPSSPRRNSAGTGTASRTSSNSTSPSMSPFGSQNLDDPISGRLKPRNLRPNGLTSPQALQYTNQHRVNNQPGCEVSGNCDKNSGRIPRYSISPSAKSGGSNSRSGSPAPSRLSAPASYRRSPPLEDGQHNSRSSVCSRIPKPRTRLPVYTRDSWKDGCY